MTLFNYDNGPSKTRGYVDVIEQDGQLLAKWHFEESSQYLPVQNPGMLPCHHFAGAPLEKTFTFGGWRYWLCDIVSP